MDEEQKEKDAQEDLKREQDKIAQSAEEKNTLNLSPIVLNKFLSPKAKALADLQRYSVVHQFEKDSLVQIDGKAEVQRELKVVVCQFALKRTVLNKEGLVDEVNVKRFANFLNDIAERNIWQHGVLSLCFMLPLAKRQRMNWKEAHAEEIDDGRPREAVICSYLFTGLRNRDGLQDSPEELNAMLGYKVFMKEGEIPSDSDWSKFPW